MALTYDEATFHSLYDGAKIEGPAGEVALGYVRGVYLPDRFRRAERLADALGLTAADAVIVIGCGFGWIVEGLRALLPGVRTAAVDISPWVQTAQAQTETVYLRSKISLAGLNPDTGKGAEELNRYDTGQARAQVVVLDQDIRGGGQARNAIYDELGTRKATWAVSDDVLPGLGLPGDDAEIFDHVGAMNALADRSAHLVTPLMPGASQDPRFNWKPMTGPGSWRELIDAIGHGDHVLVRVGSYETF